MVFTKINDEKMEIKLLKDFEIQEKDAQLAQLQQTLTQLQVLIG